jgi:hypothetical protein
MATQDSESTTIAQLVPQALERYKGASEDELLADIGQLALSDAEFAGPLSRETLVALGRQIVSGHARVKEVICSNTTIIGGAIDTANVSALVALLAPTLGFPPTAVPAAVVALSVLVLKIGLNQYCNNWEGSTSD